MPVQPSFKLLVAAQKAQIGMQHVLKGIREHSNYVLDSNPTPDAKGENIELTKDGKKQITIEVRRDLSSQRSFTFICHKNNAENEDFIKKIQASLLKESHIFIMADTSLALKVATQAPAPAAPVLFQRPHRLIYPLTTSAAVEAIAMHDTSSVDGSQRAYGLPIEVVHAYAQALLRIQQFCATEKIASPTKVKTVLETLWLASKDLPMHIAVLQAIEQDFKQQGLGKPIDGLKKAPSTIQQLQSSHNGILACFDKNLMGSLARTDFLVKELQVLREYSNV
jgi:hypothetical protein